MMVDASSRDWHETKMSAYEKTGAKLKGKSHELHKEQCAKVLSSEMVSFFSLFFYRVGHVVSNSPLLTIYLTCALVCVSSVGVLWFSAEKYPFNLWLQKSSQLYQNKLWMDQYFPQNTSSESPVPNGFVQSVIITSENIFQPDVIKGMFILHKRIVNFLDTFEQDYSQRCLRIEEFGACHNFSILRLWDYNESKIMTLTQDDINQELSHLSSRIDGEFYLKTLSGLYPNLGNTSIAGAKATMITWIVKAWNSEEENWYGPFERNFYAVAEDMKHQFDNMVYSGGRAFDTESMEAISREYKYILFGYSLVFAYMCALMSYDGDWITGILVSLSGLIAVIFSVIAMIGTCSFLGFFWVDINMIIPAILLGIGIDDMFVVVQALKNQKVKELKDHQNPKLPKSVRIEDKSKFVSCNMAQILGDIGLSIFVTSLSDVLAFLVGTGFIMPATSAVCFWMGIGIAYVFLFMNTFFMACITLIEKYRILKWKQTLDKHLFHGPVHQKSTLGQIFKGPHYPDKFSSAFKLFYIPIVTSKCMQVTTLVVSAGMLILCGYGISCVELEWDVWEVISDDSFLRDFKEVALEYFPSALKTPLQVIFRDLPFYNSTNKLTETLSYLHSLDSLSQGKNWLHSFNMFLRIAPSIVDNQTATVFPINNHLPASDTSFHYWLHYFLNSSVIDTKDDLSFNEFTIYDNDTNFSYHPLKAAKFSFVYQFHEKIKDDMTFLDGLNEKLSCLYPSNTMFLFSQIFMAIEQERYLLWDLSKNLLISLVLIGTVIFIFFANFRMGILCSFTVFISLFDVYGLIHFFCLTLEPITAMTMVVTIGLGIDFSVHLGHSFITQTGTAKERTRKALAAIGPAVVHGGISTFFAMVPLCASRAYSVQAFAKLLVSMVVIGLWHGLVFFPTILILLGPDYRLTVSQPVKVRPRKHKGRLVCKRRSIICQCVESSEVRMAKKKTRRRSARRIQKSMASSPRNDYLITPPATVRHWISPHQLAHSSGLPRIPRVQLPALPIATTTTASRVSSSPHPACPPTPSRLNALPVVCPRAEKDSLFNSSYHPGGESDDAILTTDPTVSSSASVNSAFTSVSPPPSTENEETFTSHFLRVRKTSLTVSFCGYESN